MSILLFQGDLNQRKSASLHQVVTYFQQQLLTKTDEAVEVYRLADADIPFFTPHHPQPPAAVAPLLDTFQQAEWQLWFTPLYHGSLTGAMKNALDWLQFTSQATPPYLTDKYVGLVSLSEGLQAMQGINAMEAVAKSLRAWVLPFSVPIQRSQLWDESGQLSDLYRAKCDQLTDLLVAQIPSSQSVG